MTRVFLSTRMDINLKPDCWLRLVFLPLKGGGRSAERYGWGLVLAPSARFSRRRRPNFLLHPRSRIAEPGCLYRLNSVFAARRLCPALRAVRRRLQWRASAKAHKNRARTGQWDAGVETKCPNSNREALATVFAHNQSRRGADDERVMFLLSYDRNVSQPFDPHLRLPISSGDVS